MRYTIDRRTGLSRDETPERIQDWLRSHGHADAEVISTGWNPQNGNLRVVVEAADDPQDSIETYTPTQTPRERFKETAMGDAKVIVQAIAQKPRADRSPVERALLGLAVNLGEIDDGV